MIKVGAPTEVEMKEKSPCGGCSSFNESCCRGRSGSWWRRTLIRAIGAAEKAKALMPIKRLVLGLLSEP